MKLMGYAVTQKGQVTLPKPVRERLGVGCGEEVDFRLNERGEVVIEKVDKAVLQGHLPSGAASSGRDPRPMKSSR
jgi:antitoxin PrlF